MSNSKFPRPFMGVLNTQTQKEQWVCSANRLHSYLGVKTNFARWMRRQVQKLRLVPEQDYIAFKNPRAVPIGTRYFVEYRLALYTAVAIAEGIDANKAEALRNYFDEVMGKAAETESSRVTKKQVAYIGSLVKKLVNVSGFSLQYVYTVLNKHYQITRTGDLPADSFAGVCEFLDTWIANHTDDSDDSPYSLANPAPAPVKTTTSVKRMLVCMTDEGSEITALDDDEIVARVSNLAAMIDSGVLVLSQDELSRLAITCLRKAFPV